MGYNIDWYLLQFLSEAEKRQGIPRYILNLERDLNTNLPVMVHILRPRKGILGVNDIELAELKCLGFIDTLVGFHFKGRKLNKVKNHVLETVKKSQYFNNKG